MFDYDESDLLLTWEATSFTEDELTIQLYFNNPIHMSTEGRYRRDKIIVGCNKPLLFCYKPDKVDKKSAEIPA